MVGFWESIEISELIKRIKTIEDKLGIVYIKQCDYKDGKCDMCELGITQYCRSPEQYKQWIEKWVNKS